MSKIWVFLFAALAIMLGLAYNKFNEVPEMPEMDPNKWWGSGEKPPTENTSIRPFKIEFKDTVSNTMLVFFLVMSL